MNTSNLNSSALQLLASVPEHLQPECVRLARELAAQHGLQSVNGAIMQQGIHVAQLKAFRIDLYDQMKTAKGKMKAYFKIQLTNADKELSEASNGLYNPCA